MRSLLLVLALTSACTTEPDPIVLDGAIADGKADVTGKQLSIELDGITYSDAAHITGTYQVKYDVPDKLKLRATMYVLPDATNIELDAREVDPEVTDAGFILYAVSFDRSRFPDDYEYSSDDLVDMITSWDQLRWVQCGEDNVFRGLYWDGEDATVSVTGARTYTRRECGFGVRHEYLLGVVPVPIGYPHALSGSHPFDLALHYE